MKEILFYVPFVAWVVLFLMIMGVTYAVRLNVKSIRIQNTMISMLIGRMEKIERTHIIIAAQKGDFPRGDSYERKWTGDGWEGPDDAA